MPGKTPMGHKVRCITADDVNYEVTNLREDIQSGQTRLITTKSSIFNGVIDADYSNIVTSQSISTAAMIKPQEGTFTMAVIRVTGRDGYSPSMSRQELSDGIFNDSLNLVSDNAYLAITSMLQLSTDTAHI